jgi:hypothetical protein
MPTKSVNARRTLKIIAWTVAISAASLNAPASDPPNPKSFGASEHEVSIIGLEVKGSRDKTLGDVKDLALDLENGRIVEVIVASGGFMGLGQKTVAAPPGAFQFDAAAGVLRLNVDKEKFNSAPEFEMSKRAENFTSRRVAEVYRFFGQKPYFAEDGEKPGNTATEPLGFVQRSSKLSHFAVKNRQNKLLGRLESFQYSLWNGRVVHVVVLNPGYRHTKSVIPARALRFNAAHDSLNLDDSEQAFKDEPRFKSAATDYGDRGDFGDYGVSGASGTYGTFGAYGEYGDYGNYGDYGDFGDTGDYGPYGKFGAYGNRGAKEDFQQETYTNRIVAANGGVDTKQNVQEGSAKAHTPLAQGPGFADMETTRRIYAAMRADASLSKNAQNVEVGTVDGRVTLRGHVNTEGGKQTIGKIASWVARPENVSNLLEVRPLPVSNQPEPPLEPARHEQFRTGPPRPAATALYPRKNRSFATNLPSFGHTRAFDFDGKFCVCAKSPLHFL